LCIYFRQRNRLHSWRLLDQNSGPLPHVVGHWSSSNGRFYVWRTGRQNLQIVRIVFSNSVGFASNN
jgi:hypothetical protein